MLHRTYPVQYVPAAEVLPTPAIADFTAVQGEVVTSALNAHEARRDNPHEVSKTQVGLGNVTNTSDANKPVSSAVQTALDLKAPLANPTFTGTVAGISKSMVGLGSVDNTADAGKPVSTAAQTALDAKANTASLATVATTGSYSDLLSKPTLGTAAAQPATRFPMIFRLTGLNVNQANTDLGSFTGLPARYIVRALWFENASATPTLSTISLRTASGGGGSAIINAQALSSLVSSTTLLSATMAINAVQTVSSLVLRADVAAGGAATVDATLEIVPLV